MLADKKSLIKYIVSVEIKLSIYRLDIKLYMHISICRHAYTDMFVKIDCDAA